MRVLFYEWESYLQYDVREICREKGLYLEPFSWKFLDKNEDERFEYWFEHNIESSRFDAIFSINYWPLLSKEAQKNGIRYIAWCYDNPLNVINIEDTLSNTVNEIYFFDRLQAQEYIEKGFETVYYLPLAVNVGRMKRMQLTSDDRKRYTADISFVGSLYESKISEIKTILDEYAKGYIDAVMAAQQNIYGYYLIDKVVTNDFMTDINNHIENTYPKSNFKLLKEALTFAMASEVTRKDRLTLLTILGRRFNTRIYSYQTSSVLQGVNCLPPVDYVMEMPKVFACSKINLNPILRCIQSGIPLRAIDIMGAGGVLLSSYQPELAELFEQENEMMMYESIGDAIEKCHFLLKNDDVRMKMAINGQRKVFENFSMENRIEKILAFN